MAYEHWLNHENQVLMEQLKYYETEVHKLRKARKVPVINFVILMYLHIIN